VNSTRPTKMEYRKAFYNVNLVRIDKINKDCQFLMWEMAMAKKVMLKLKKKNSNGFA
jgi:hypothetical protein